MAGSREEGIHRVTWNLRKSVAEPGAAPGERIEPGRYVVRLLVNGRTMSAPLEVRSDPNRGR